MLGVSRDSHMKIGRGALTIEHFFGSRRYVTAEEWNGKPKIATPGVIGTESLDGALEEICIRNDPHSESARLDTCKLMQAYDPETELVIVNLSMSFLSCVEYVRLRDAGDGNVHIADHVEAHYEYQDFPRSLIENAANLDDSSFGIELPQKDGSDRNDAS